MLLFLSFIPILLVIFVSFFWWNDLLVLFEYYHLSRFVFFLQAWWTWSSLSSDVIALEINDVNFVWQSPQDWRETFVKFNSHLNSPETTSAKFIQKRISRQKKTFHWTLFSLFWNSLVEKLSLWISNIACTTDRINLYSFTRTAIDPKGSSSIEYRISYVNDIVSLGSGISGTLHWAFCFTCWETSI